MNNIEKYKIKLYIIQVKKINNKCYNQTTPSSEQRLPYPLNCLKYNIC